MKAKNRQHRRLPDVVHIRTHTGAPAAAMLSGASYTTTICLPLGAHAPPHPPNVLPRTAEALNVTFVPGAKFAEHVPLADPETSVHPIPRGVELTVPVP